MSRYSRARYFMRRKVESGDDLEQTAEDDDDEECARR